MKKSYKKPEILEVVLYEYDSVLTGGASGVVEIPADPNEEGEGA